MPEMPWGKSTPWKSTPRNSQSHYLQAEVLQIGVSILFTSAVYFEVDSVKDLKSTWVN